VNTPESTPPPAASLFRHVLVYGGAAGLAVIIWNLLEYAFGVHGEHISMRAYTALVSMIFPVAAIAYGLIRWRDKALGGLIRFREGFGCGLAIGLVFSAVVGAFNWVYVSFINPEIIDVLIANQVVVMQEAGSSPEEIAQVTETTRASATPGAYAFAVFAQMLISVFLVALFASILLRRRH
jgi:hypothetical protein